MFWKTVVNSRSGKAAEDRALAFLLRHGLTLRTRNYACKAGELDLVMEDRDTLVFVEVKYRAASAYGSAVEAVGYRKQQRLNRAALHYLQNFNLTDSCPCRFDIIAICPAAGSDNHRDIQWLKNAFGP